MARKRWVKIPDVLFFQEGPGVRNTQYTNDGVKLLNVANLVDGKVDLSTSERYISESEAYGKYSHFLCDEGDFIVASSGIKVEYIDKKMGFIDKSMLPLCMNTSTIRFKVLNPNELRIRYFMYYLKSQHFKGQLFKQITGSAQLNYGPSHLKKMDLPLIDIGDQDIIIERLDKLQRIIDYRQEEINKLDELIKARFVEMFENGEHPIEKLGVICTKITDGTHKTPNYLAEGVTFISAKNIVNGELNFSDVKYISEEEYQEIQKRCQTEKLDILLSKSGSLGSSAIVRTDEKLGLFESLAVLKYDRTKIVPEFLCEQLKSEKVQRQFSEGTKGVAIKHLHLGVISDTNIIIPSMEEQAAFADFVKQVNKSKSVIQKSLEETQLLFDSLMQEYFG